MFLGVVGQSDKPGCSLEDGNERPGSTGGGAGGRRAVLVYTSVSRDRKQDTRGTE